MPKHDYLEEEEIKEEEELEDEEDELDRGDDFDEDEDSEDEDESNDEDDEDESDESEDSGDEDDETEEEDPKESEEEARIPKSRLDQVLSQRDAERERTQWLESQLEKLIEQGGTTKAEEEQEVDPFDYDAAESKYGELLFEGETDKAAQVRSLINRSRQEDMEAMIAKITNEVTDKASTQSTAQFENSKFDDLVESYEGLYPFLDSSSPKHDESKVDMVNTLLAGYVAQGKTKREGLRLAVKNVVPKGDPKADKTSLGNKERTKASRQKKADTSNRQPPKTRSAKMKSVNTEDVMVSKLSERDYNKLSLRERKILRGD